MFSKTAMRMSTVGAIAALPLSLAGIANAATGPHPSLVRPMNGTECETKDYIGGSNDATAICTQVYGSGTYVNTVVVTVGPGDGASPSDDWFPVYAGCTVQAGWMLWNNAGNSNYNNWSAPMSCSALKGAGGWVDTPDRQMEAGALCGYVYFPAFGQFGGHNCVTVH
jgi:hypothetical protein